jgi:hypothetical protein
MKARPANTLYKTKRGRKMSVEHVRNGMHGKISISSMTQEGLNSMSLFYKRGVCRVTKIFMNK